MAGPEGEGWRPAESPWLPEIVQLDSVRIDPRTPTLTDTTYRAASIEGRTIRDHPFYAWRFVAGDSVWVGHPAAYSGQVLRVAAATDTLTGTLESYTDVMGAEVPPPGPARLVRTACPDWMSAVGGAR